MNEAIEKLKAQLASKEEELQAVWKELAPIEKRRDKIWKVYNTLKERLGNATVKYMEGKEEVDWEWVLKHEDSMGMKQYHFKEKMIRDTGLMTAGYNPETNQTAIEVCLIKDDEESVKKTQDALNLVLPYLKSNKEGYIYIAIFEHTLSQHGMYFFFVYPERDRDKYVLMKSVYHHEEEIKVFGELEDCLKYIQNHYWYKRKGDD